MLLLVAAGKNPCQRHPANVLQKKTNTNTNTDRRGRAAFEANSRFQVAVVAHRVFLLLLVAAGQKITANDIHPMFYKKYKDK